ncbi:uncharacterized protein BO72DRAFT_135086 [Aspergillus fijiensis CBS 313.89]|uniref:Uncharacterized protein n=1 Tax=Aspergillus fijiensis CBS 313.89 TaxID=1448319 RepID=A0A8G1RLW4_9EURO|nr:uncharacterized protein BO72DRAFT_135086 [Aspergillus fijiensis CBS 313.89]RAK76432.1 hypothetical protein BO72DRAFT_135086 [Aspergillus fijiensis CBS 313.89]
MSANSSIQLSCRASNHITFNNAFTPSFPRQLSSPVYIIVFFFSLTPLSRFIFRPSPSLVLSVVVNLLTSSRYRHTSLPTTNEPSLTLNSLSLLTTHPANCSEVQRASIAHPRALYPRVPLCRIQGNSIRNCRFPRAARSQYRTYPETQSPSSMRPQQSVTSTDSVTLQTQCSLLHTRP